jgi:hypothetical protein
METLTVVCTCTEKDYVKAARAIMMRGPASWVLWLVGLGMTTCVIVALVRSGDTGSFFRFALLLPAFMVLYTFVLSPMLIARRVRKHERLRTEVTWQFSDVDVLMSNKYSEVRIDWGTFQTVRETKEYYLLAYTVNKRVHQFIPKRAFESEEQEEAFRELLRNHGLME